MVDSFTKKCCSTLTEMFISSRQVPCYYPTVSWPSDTDMLYSKLTTLTLDAIYVAPRMFQDWMKTAAPVLNEIHFFRVRINGPPRKWKRILDTLRDHPNALSIEGGFYSGDDHIHDYTNFGCDSNRNYNPRGEEDVDEPCQNVSLVRRVEASLGKYICKQGGWDDELKVYYV
jgi:hypothetical protein